MLFSAFLLLTSAFALDTRQVTTCKTPTFAADPTSLIKHPGGLMGQAELARLRTIKTNPNFTAWINQLSAATPLTYKATTQSKLSMYWNLNGFLDANPTLKAATDATNQNFIFTSGLQTYQQAIMFQITCNEQYAKNALAIIRDWTAAIVSYEPSVAGQSSQNAALVWAWAMASWLKTLELLKYTYSGYDALLEKNVLAMLTRLNIESVWNSVLAPTSYSSVLVVGNWHTSIIEAKLYLALLKNDKAGVAYAQNYYKRMVDGIPNPANTTQSDKIYIAYTGQEYETCRDMDHAQYGVGGMVQLAEAFYQQGVDLYSYGGKSALVTGLPGLGQVVETHAYITNHGPTGAWPPGVTPNGNVWKPASFGQGTACVLKEIAFKASGYELAFNHFNRRKGFAMANTKLTLQNRYTAYGPDMYYFHWGLGSFTHGQKM